MIILKQLAWWERVLLRLVPSRRRRYQRELKAAMRYAVEHPEEPVRFTG